MQNQKERSENGKLRSFSDLTYAILLIRKILVLHIKEQVICGIILNISLYSEKKEDDFWKVSRETV